MLKHESTINTPKHRAHTRFITFQNESMTGHETGRMCSTQNMLGWVTEMSHAKRTCKAVYLQVAVYAATGRRRTLLRGYCLQRVCLQCVYLLCMQQRIPLAIDVPVSGTKTNRTSLYPEQRLTARAYAATDLHLPSAPNSPSRSSSSICSKSRLGSSSWTQNLHQLSLQFRVTELGRQWPKLS